MAHTPHKIVITLTTSNAAFAEDEGWEVGRILGELAERYRHGDCIPGTLRDINGNTVGRVETKRAVRRG